MSLKNNLLRLLKDPNYVPLNTRGLARKLKLKKAKEQKELEVLIPQLLKDGSIAQVKHGCFVVSQDADLISGTIKFKASGAAILIPDPQPNNPSPEAIDIMAMDTDVALHGDHVLVRIKKERSRGRYKKGRRLPGPEDNKIYGRVKRILKRKFTSIPGTLKKGRTCYFVIPDDPKFIYDIIVEHPKDSKLTPLPQIDDKVIVELFDWTHRNKSPEGIITKVLGPTHHPMVEYEALLHKYSLSPEFPEAVLREAHSIPQKVDPSEVSQRCDCRDIFTITIDPDDAKDFDDALSVEYYENDEVCIGIHIADVASYVRSGSQLDKEAQKRGNSTYLVGTVIPMIPHDLSNGICSLVEAEDRLVKSVFVTFNKDGKIIDHEFANSVIRSNKRLTYRQAYAFLTEKDLDVVKNLPLPPAHQTGSTGRALNSLSKKELQILQKNIKMLWKFAAKLRKDRMQKGSLDFDMPEVKIFVDEEGRADRIETIDYDESHQLIEEYMLLANEIIAKELFDNKMAFISRVHDAPDPEKLNELRDTLLTFGIHTGDLTKRKSVVTLLQKIKHHDQNYTLKIQFLRSLKQACYRARADGHYGLYKTYYTHFTSPIRRYSDLITHRVFDNFLIKHGYDTAIDHLRRVYKQSELASLAQHISITEQNSTEAERESVKIKLLEFFERENNKEVKTPFEAIITDVKNHGIFIELTGSMAFGLVHMSTLKDDLYKLDSKGISLVGRKNGKTYSIGQKVKVIIDKVDRFRRQLDFQLAE